MAEFTIRQAAHPGDTWQDETCPHCNNPRWKAFDGVWEENCQCYWDNLAIAAHDQALIDAAEADEYERQRLEELCQAIVATLPELRLQAKVTKIPLHCADGRRSPEGCRLRKPWTLVCEECPQRARRTGN